MTFTMLARKKKLKAIILLLAAVDREPEHYAVQQCVCVLTIKPVDTHHKVYAVIELLVVFLRWEVGQIRCQERKVAVQAGLKAQLFEQLLFGFVETGEKVNNIYQKKQKKQEIMCVLAVEK